MGAIRIVQTALRNEQIVENLSAQDRLGDNPRNIRQCDAPVPNPLRVNDNGRAMLALIEATCVIRPRQQTDPRSLDLDLERVPQGLFSFWITATPFMAGFSNIAAYKNMVMKSCHV
jgi:hypothetical protein